jgi:ribosomal protein S17
MTRCIKPVSLKITYYFKHYKFMKRPKNHDTFLHLKYNSTNQINVLMFLTTYCQPISTIKAFTIVNLLK